jgi:hypothetical protein
MEKESAFGPDFEVKDLAITIFPQGFAMQRMSECRDNCTGSMWSCMGNTSCGNDTVMTNIARPGEGRELDLEATKRSLREVLDQMESNLEGAMKAVREERQRIEGSSKA